MTQLSEMAVLAHRESGTDLLRLTGLSGGFAMLRISDRNAHLEILRDGGIIVLERQAGTILTSADFDFL